MHRRFSLPGRRARTVAGAACLLSLLSLVLAPPTRAEVAVGEPEVGAEGLPSAPVYVPDSELPFELRKIGGTLELPWAIAWLPDGRMLVTERRGRLRLIEGDRMLPDSIAGIPQVLSGGHAGLLDVLVDKDFPTTHRLYLSYMHGTPEAATIRIARATLDETTLIDKQVIFESRPAIKGVDQIGGRLAYGPDGLIYLSIGDRFQQDRAQNLLDDGGKIIRIRDDGSIPDDNPFVGRPDALPEIFSYGHRNPQGLLADRGDGQIWSVEQGPKGGDELNLITRGSDYGWPLVTFGINYDGTIISDKTSAPGLVDPIYHWTPSLATASVAAYNGNTMPDDWRGNLLIGTLVGETLVRLVIDEGKVVKEERYLHKTIGRIRDVAVGPDGYIYLLTDGTEASIYRLEPLTDTVANRHPFP